jgi:hypothetical protein
MTTKICPNCSNRDLVRLSTLNLKFCPDCHTWIPWKLSEGQQPIVTNNRVKAGQVVPSDPE